ncbi:carbohydrate phosphatase [Annulohypoxylon maeteangense]|uniref:carbohydrate phosphatase n=1 Tax=Annulohypoxylon maeteangense TaxID=1927788 RepID=UPI0020074FAA|nr:carbohydrate phosphatase [Annulohypoxylon maeteangense]KAI0882081.1 carbohydrate phosphatase [Annulohypoxylon maeteangense]
MDSPYSQELQVAIGAIQAAAKLSQGVISKADKGVIAKDDLSPVTVADFAIQALLTATVHHAFPHDRFVGEEAAAELRENPVLLERVWELLQSLRDEEVSQLCRLPESREAMCEMIDWCGFGEPGGARAGRVWVFDPIDGTKTFVEGMAYAINVALLEGSRQVLSVVGCPTLAFDAIAPVTNTSLDPTGRGCIAFAVKGYGTYVRPLVVPSTAEVQVRRIEPLAEMESSQILRPVSCYNMLDSGVDDVHNIIMQRLNVESQGCDLLAWVLRWVTLGLGLANMTVWVYKKRERTGKIWDHAGAMLLFEEIGGYITDIDGKPIDLGVGRKMTANHGFVAAPKAIHPLVLKTTQEVIREQGKGHLLA